MSLTLRSPLSTFPQLALAELSRQGRTIDDIFQEAVDVVLNDSVLDVSNERGLQDEVHNLFYQLIVRGIIILFFAF